MTRHRSSAPRPAPSGRAARIRAFCAGGREADIAARLPGLTTFLQDDPESLRAALRAVRKARLQAPQTYDAVRHAALLRLLKQTAPSRGTAPCAKIKKRPSRS